MNCNRVAVSYAGRGRRSDLPDGLRQAGTTNDGRFENDADNDSLPWALSVAASTCETIKNYNIEHFALLLWFHNWRRFFKYNDKTHFKIGIQPRHRRLHWRFAAIRRSLHSQKKCAAPTADGGTSGTCKTKRTGVFGRINTDIAMSSGHHGQRPLLLGGGG